MRRVGAWIAGAAVLGLGGCGGEEPPATQAWQAPASAGADAAENQVPEVASLWLEPSDPLPDSRVRAVADVRDPDGDAITREFHWSVAGRELDETGEEISLAGAVKGDEIAVWLRARDGHGESEPAHASATVGNQRPRLANVALEPRGSVLPGQVAVAKPIADDPDGDELTFRFRWTVNDETREDSDASSFPTEGLQPGDRIRVEVLASDGDAQSDEAWSGILLVGNAAPEITSRPGPMAAGEPFRYRVEARDPEGDRNLRYTLRKGPDGMSMNAVLGDVVWQPRPEQVGSHTVEIAVEDSAGARSVQTFELTVAAGEAPAPAAPAPAAPEGR